MVDKKTIAITILGILFIVTLLGWIGEISEKTTIEKPEAEQEQPSVVSPTKEPTAEPTSEPIEEGVPTFKVGSWKVFSGHHDHNTYLSIRFSTSEDTTIELIGPDGISTDSVKYEIIQKPSQMIGETVELKMGGHRVIPQAGTYKLVVTQHEKVVFTKDFTFEGPKLIIRWEPHYKYNEVGKLQLDFLDVFMKNDGDMPIYFGCIKRFIAGGDKNLDSCGWLGPNTNRIGPNKEELILTRSTGFPKTLPTEESDELTLWIEDTSGQVHKFTKTVNPLEHIT